MHREQKDRLIALIATAATVGVLMVILFFGSIKWDRDALSRVSVEDESEDEELFIDPELVDLGEMEAPATDAPAPSELGEPEKAEEDNPDPVEKGDNPKPAPMVEKKVTQHNESPVKTSEPSATEKEKKRVTSKVADSFSGRNGKTDGKFGHTGSGDAGVGVSGNARGRTFLGCPKPEVELSRRTLVTVDITVDESGRVVSASARGSANAQIRRKCEQSARQARWSKKPGAGITPGTITFTITPA